MDFSKIKKIFYIVAIISMLLSIKSKVFGASYEYTFADTNDSISLFPLSDYYIYCYGKKDGSSYRIQLIVCDEQFTITNDKEYISLPLNSHYWNVTGTINLTTLNNQIQNFTAPSNTVTASWRIHGSFINTWSNQNLFTNFDLKYENGDTFNPNNVSIDPFFSNPEELEDAPENVFIELGDYSANDYLYFHLLEVTNIMPMSNSDSTYYYNDKTFALNKDSKYYTQLLDTTKYYYSIPRSALGLNPDTSYFYVLTNSKTQIDNSINPITEGDDIYDVIMQDTTGIITQDMATNDKLQNINQEFNEYKQQQEEFQNQNSLTPETETDIENSLGYSNSNAEITNMRQGFFTRLSQMLANLTNYNLREDTAVAIPFPNTQKNITLHSIDIYNNVGEPLKTIINLFWIFIFNFYLYKFINHLYIAITTGKILKDFNATNETITNHML